MTFPANHLVGDPGHTAAHNAIEAALNLSVAVRDGDQAVTVPSFLAGGQQLVANNATATFAFAANDNALSRAMYFIMADIPGNGGAIVFSSGSAGVMQTLAAGDAFAIGLTYPNVAGRFNVYLTANVLTVLNRYGSTRRVSVLPLGFL